MSLTVPGAIRRDSTLAIAITGSVTGEKICVPGPCRLLRLGAEITVATSGTDGVVTANKINGDDTAVSLGTMTIPDLTADNGCYRDFTDAPLIEAGSFLSVNLTTAAGTGSGVLWVEYMPLPWSSAELATLSKVTT